MINRDTAQEKIYELDDVPSVAREVLGAVEKTQQATVVVFCGELGAGKTTLIRTIAQHLGVKGNVISPTYVIEKVYRLSSPVFKTLIHIDAYRLQSGAELSELDWQDRIAKPDTLILLEWPENVLDVLPEDVWVVTIQHKSESSRTIRICCGIDCFHNGKKSKGKKDTGPT